MGTANFFPPYILLAKGFVIALECAYVALPSVKLSHISSQFALVYGNRAELKLNASESTCA